MINETEVPDLIERQIPDLATDINNTREKVNIYQTMQTLLQFTGRKIQEHNYLSVKQCFAIAEKLYEKGNRSVQNAVENVFVFSFSNLLPADSAEKKKILAIVPITIYSLYIHQLHATGC